MSQFPNAFNQDTILQKTFADLVAEVSPTLILETGTHRADTTEYLASFEVPVISTEINSDFFNISSDKLKNKSNVKLLLGDSATALRDNFSLLENENILAFLDSHLLNDTVLERELELLAEVKSKPTIIIHDFFVPGKDFGYDTWDGHRYDYEFYKSYFDKIYGVDNYEYRYNQEAVGARRGVIIVLPR